MAGALSGVFTDARKYSSAITAISTLPESADARKVDLFNETIQSLLDGASKINFNEHPELVSPEVLDALCEISTRGPRAQTIREEGSVFLIGKLMDSELAKNLPIETVQKVLTTLSGLVGRGDEHEQLRDGIHPYTAGYRSTGETAADTIGDIVRAFPIQTWKSIGPALIDRMLAVSPTTGDLSGITLSYMITRDPSLLTEKLAASLFEKATVNKVSAIYGGLGTIGTISGSVQGDSFVPYGDPVPLAGLKEIVRGHTKLFGETAINDDKTLGESAKRHIESLALLYRGPVWDKELKPVFLDTAESLGFKDDAKTVLEDIDSAIWDEKAKAIKAELPKIEKPAAPR